MNETLRIFRLEPFRILFPIGYFFLVFGLGVWSVNLMGESVEASRAHAVFLANGFLFSFALGILLSEVPTLLRVAPMPALQLAALFATLAGTGVFALDGNIFQAQLFHLASLANAAAYLGLSLMRTEVRGQPGPALAFAGLFAWIVGTALWLPAESDNLPREFGRWGALAGLQGFLLLFASAGVRWSTPARSNTLSFLAWGLPALAASLFLEAVGNESAHPQIYLRMAYAARALIFMAFVTRPINVHALWENKPLYGFYVRLGMLCVFLGNLLSAFHPARVVLFNHVAYLGGFAWMFLALATCTATGRLKNPGRKRGQAFVGYGGLSLLAALALRIGAGYSPHARGFLLTTAAVLALAPVFAWAVAFFPSLADSENRKQMKEKHA